MLLRCLRLPLLLGALLCPSLAGAAPAAVRDGHTLQLGDVVYVLSGIDAPEVDQLCLDDHADPVACGVQGRDRLAALVAGRDVRCEDKGPDATFRNRRSGLCFVDKEAVSLNQQLVRLGLAVSGPQGPFRADAETARGARTGLWMGCFVAPADFRAFRKDAPLLGAACRPETEAATRTALFPEEATAPPGCTVKGRYSARARFTGHVGIFHGQVCRSYSTVTRPQRWFCSEDDARAAGFRRAYNCRPRVQRPRPG
jgi:endonuclease YncB( thermonuclease family)